MKKLTFRFKKWLVYRATCTKKRNRRAAGRLRLSNTVLAWDGASWIEVVCTKEPVAPPKNLSLKENVTQTLEFFSEFRENCLAPISKLKKNRKQRKQIDKSLAHGWVTPGQANRLPNIRSYYDFTRIENIGTSAALILTAEYDRLARIIEKVPVAIDIHKWNDNVFNKLYELGFFEILGLTDALEDRYTDHGSIRTMKILSGSNASDLQKASEQLLDLCRFVDPELQLNQEQQIALNTAVSEGMINVARHAYDKEHEADFKFQHVKSWWLTATANKDTRQLTVALFDQGASIPVTLPKQPRWKEILSKAFSSFSTGGTYDHDGRYIQTALNLRETSTNEPGRGLGLPQMKELIDTFKLGSLTIWSRGGQCCYEASGLKNVDAHIYSVGGTLIEWIIELPRAVTNE